MDRGVWRATAQGVAKSQARLHDWAHTRAHTVLFTVALCIDRSQGLLRQLLSKRQEITELGEDVSENVYWYSHYGK